MHSRHGRSMTRFLEVAEPNPPPQPHPHVKEGVDENELDLCQVLDQFTRKVTTALQGRYNTEASDFKRVKEFEAHDYFGNVYPAEGENLLTYFERVFDVMRSLNEDRIC